MIEIYDINNGKLKYSAYTLSQLCEMVREDFAYHTGDEDNHILWWIDEKARELCEAGKKPHVLSQLQNLLELAEKEGHRAFASQVSALLGEISLGDAQYKSAIEYLQKAVDLLPSNVEAIHQLARTFAARGEYRKAVEAWRRANGIFACEEAYLALAEAMEKLEDFDEQERTLRSLLRDCPRSIKGLDMLAQFYRSRGKTKDAARLAQRIVELRPEKGKHFGPFFDEFGEALIWSRHNYDYGKVDKVLEFLDEEQKRNPDEWLSLLKSVMLYKLDRNLCREECCYELRKYFDGVGYDKRIVGKDLRDVVRVLGEDFSRGVVRFIKNRFRKDDIRKEKPKSSGEGLNRSCGVSPSGQKQPLRAAPDVSRRIYFWPDPRFCSEEEKSNRTV